MASMQDRLKLKRGSCDTWTIREQLCLASSVLKSGDQNWMSVSRSLKPFIEKELLRPPDWFSQKSCAMQYAHLLENTDTPKRKKRESGETTSESIVRKLKQERITELNQALIFNKNEYLRLKSDINQLKSGAISDENLENMWHEMQQEEREVEQKTRLHLAWVAKRQQQQKQDMSLPSSSTSIANQTRKLVESTMDTTVQEPAVTEPSTENDDEKKNNRGGRSPLLTSLLKSPSPTTQTMQSFSSTSVQVSSPTITSLLGSSPKILNTQLTQNVSPQLQQLVSTAIASGNANVTSERPSVGAPTLSMLLEMPASAQRGPLPNLQTTNPAASIQQQQQQQQTAVTSATTTTTTEVHNFQQTVQSQPEIHQMTTQNETTNAATVVTIPATATPALTAIVTAPTSIPVSENMVQIIDHIDDVIRKDIMTDVIDKDEINEIIGDIEELIKKEITHSPQTLDTNALMTTTTTTTTMTTTTTITTTMTTTITTTMTTTMTTTATLMTTSTTTATTPTTTVTMATAAVIGGPVGASQQTSEIPTVVQPKSEPRDVDEAVSLSDSPQSEMAIEEIDSSTSNIAEIIGTVAIEPQEPKVIVAEVTEPVTNTSEESCKLEASICDEKMTEDIPQLETNNTKGSKNTSAEGKQLDAEMKSSNAETAENDSKRLEKAKQTTEEIVEEEVEAVEKEQEEEEEVEVIVSEDKESSENVKERKELAEETEGEQQDVPSTEVVSVSSEVMNDVHSTEDTKKSQDISLILEDDESSQNSESKKKAVAEEQTIENTAENTESVESLKDETAISAKDKIIVEVKEELSVKSQEEETVEETLEIYTDEFKKEEIKDSSEDTTGFILPDTEIKEEEIGSETAEDTHVVTVEEVESDKGEPADAVAISTDVSIKKTETPEVKSEPEAKSEPKTESEPEASGLFHGKSPVHGLGMEEEKKEKVEIKEEKEDVKKTIEQSEQNIKKEIESTVGEEPGELDEEESSLSKLSSARAMKTYSKRQNVAMDSEPETEGTGEGADYRAWKKAVMLVYNRLATHKYASVFLRPITEDQAPGYHTVIFRPMDLLTIKKNIDNGTIRSTMHFQRDVMLMFQNAIMYNKHDTFIYKMAVSMQEECLQHMQILVQVTGEGTFRRETRTATSSSSETSESILKRKRSHITPSPHDTDNPRSKKRRKSEND